MPNDLRLKTLLVIDEIKSFRRVIVALSGGVDSALVACLAKIALDNQVIAVTANSPALPSEELKETKLLAKQIGIEHVVIQTEELQDLNYASNPPNRCYFCKKELSEKLKQLAATMNAGFIIDGTNADDLSGHRPGTAALSENGVRSPLAEANITKAEVRQLARLFGLQNFDKPSMPCLASRVQYGLEITPDRLLRIEKAESFIRNLTRVRELRVRDHGNLARIEVGKDERSVFFDRELLDSVSTALRDLGFLYVALDVTGYRTGSMDEPVKNGRSDSLDLEGSKANRHEQEV